MNKTNIVIGFTAPLGPLSAGDTITIAGVRLNVVPITAQLANEIAVSAVFDPANISTGGVIQAASATIEISELAGFIEAFETVGNGAIDATQAIIHISGMPAGTTLTNVAIAAPTSFTINAAVPAAFTATLPLAGPSIKVPIQINSQSYLSQERIDVILTFGVAAGVSYISPGSATAAVTLGPAATPAELSNPGGIPFNPATNAGIGGCRYFPNPKGSVTVLNVSAPQSPVLKITMSKAAYANGDNVEASEFRLENQEPASACELKVWIKIPGIPPIGIINHGADGSWSLPQAYSQELGPLQLFAVTSALPRGVYEFNSRVLNPSTGDKISENINTFTLQ